MIDERIIRQWWDVFRPDNALTEIRILAGKKNFSGYFTDVETLLSQIRMSENLGGIYATINPVLDSCYGRVQHDKLMQFAKAQTSDGDIAKRAYILVDLDPERPSDTNATDEQKNKAYSVAWEVFKFLSSQGFEKPIMADSANGYHLYYRVDLPNDEESTTLVKDFLSAVDMMCSTDEVKVDTSVFNASRIVKLIGTQSRKGSNTKAQPQRMSFFINIPDEVKVTDVAYIRKVAAMLPKAEPPSSRNGYNSERFDIEGFISKHGIKVARRGKFKEGEKLILEECPFDPNHKAPDSAIFVMNDGAIGFRCLHNSCSHFSWHDLRMRFEPDAYQRKDLAEFARKRRYYAKVVPSYAIAGEPTKDGKKWLSMTDIKWVDPSTVESIPSGIEILDKKMAGWTLGEVTVFSGGSGSGKTTILDTFALNAVQRGYKVAMFSGEIPSDRFQSWIDQIAAGKANVYKDYRYENSYHPTRDVAEKINRWLDGSLFLYNNEYGNNDEFIFKSLEELVEKEGVRLIILDNLMTVDLDSDGTENEKQTAFIKGLKNFARKWSVHVILVCHPRKEQSFQLLRKESISGTANLTNLCDNLIIMHRIGRDFDRRAKDFFGTETTQRLMDTYDNVMEVAKNRSFGVVDLLIGLFFERESRRLKNTKEEHIVYGWDDSPTLIPEDDLPPDELPFDSTWR